MSVTTNHAEHPWVTAGLERVRFGIQMNVLPDWGATRAFAQAAESLGFDSLWRADHPIASGNSAWVSLAALAEATDRIRLGTLVSCVFYWNPVLLARMAADVDRISGGRVVLGLGSGNLASEFGQLGIEFPSPAARQTALAESVQIIRSLLRGERVAFDGDWFQTHDAVLAPPPPQQPYVPILVGGGGERTALRLVAQYADATNLGPAPWAGQVRTPEDARRKFEILRGHCVDVGRPYESVLRTTMVGLCLATSPSTLQEKVDRIPPPAFALFQQGAVIGTPEEACQRVRALLEAGFQYIILLVFAFDQETLQLAAERVVPSVQHEVQSVGLVTA